MRNQNKVGYMNTEFLEKAQENVKMATWQSDASLRNFELSNTLCKMFKLEENTFYSLNELAELIFYKDVDAVLQLFQETSEYGIPFDVDFRSDIDGEIKYFTLHCDVEYKDNNIASLFGTIQDITTKSIEHNNIKNYIELIDKYIITSKTDIKGNIIYVSQAFSDISGYSKAELMGQNHRLVRHPDMPDSMFKDLWSTVCKGETWQAEVKNLRKDGSFYWVLATVSPTYNERDEITGYQAIRQDITDKKYIEQIAITDGLTSLYNRRHFNDVMPDEINRAKRNSSMLVFTMLDVDNFKKYNDTYGHQMGDEVLISIAGTLENSFQRAEDLVFRLGGEEFGAIFRVENENDIFEIVDKARQNIQALAIEHTENQASVVTASFGIIKIDLTSNKDVSQIVECLYKEADEALYKAKESGRNKVVFN